MGPELQPANEAAAPEDDDGGGDDDGHDDDHPFALAAAETVWAELEPAAELFAEEEGVAASPKSVLITNLGYQRLHISLGHWEQTRLGQHSEANGKKSSMRIFGSCLRMTMTTFLSTADSHGES